MSKWRKVSAADIKVGDRVRIKYLGMARNDYSTVTGTVRKIDHYGYISFGDGFLRSPSTGACTWYVRKPKPAKLKAPKWAEPLTRPAEPPVGTFFRVDRTGLAYVRMDNDEFGYVHAAARGCHRWVTITEPGDTWTRLELMEVRG